jgi:hypothetical protein
MTVHPRTDSVDGLPDVNRNAVKVAQHIVANFVGRPALTLSSQNYARV